MFEIIARIKSNGNGVFRGLQFSWFLQNALINGELHH
jgi:hypothetical protein